MQPKAATALRKSDNRNPQASVARSSTFKHPSFHKCRQFAGQLCAKVSLTVRVLTLDSWECQNIRDPAIDPRYMDQNYA